MLEKTKVSETSPFISVRDLEVIYPDGTVALRPVSLDFSDREITILLGPSGAGKSTLLRALNHLVVPTSGIVSTRGFGAITSGRALRKHRRRTAMIFQQHQLIGRLSALQNVLLGRIGDYPTLRTVLPLPLHERKWALECLDRVGLFDKALQRVDSLSGGQQQRVGIARAIAQKPDLILADEPVASLDPATSEHILEMLRSVCRQDGIPAIISLHQLEYAKKYGDRVIGLSRGELAFDGYPGELNAKVLDTIYRA